MFKQRKRKNDVIKIETVIFSLCNLSVNKEKTLLAYQNIDKNRKNIYIYIYMFICVIAIVFILFQN